MKTLRLIGMALIGVLVSVCITACSSDDDNDDGGNNYKSLIVGKWKLTSNVSGNIHTHLEFRKDGTFSYTSTKEIDYEEHGKYKIDGDYLYELFSDEDDWSMYKIILLNSMTLTIQEKALYDKDTYQRVN